MDIGGLSQILLSGGGGATLALFASAFVTRKKDAGELATGLLKECIVDIAKLKADNEKCQTETASLRALATRNDIVIRLVVPELQRVSPYSSALTQAKDLLGSAFPAPADMPAEMQAALDALDTP